MKQKKQAKVKTPIIDKENKTVTYVVKSHGLYFAGRSKCQDEVFDEERGIQIAKLRAEILQRSHDRELTREFIENIKTLYDLFVNDQGRGANMSPHWMHAIQAASEELKVQSKHIKELNARVAQLIEWVTTDKVPQAV